MKNPRHFLTRVFYCGVRYLDGSDRYAYIYPASLGRAAHVSILERYKHPRPHTLPGSVWRLARQENIALVRGASSGDEVTGFVGLRSCPVPGKVVKE